MTTTQHRAAQSQENHQVARVGGTSERPGHESHSSNPVEPLPVWLQLGQDIDGEAEFNLYGASVSLSRDGSIVAVGAPGNNDNGPGSGHVRVHQYTKETKSWEQVGQDIVGDAVGDSAGWSVSLSDMGHVLAIGSDLADDGFGSVSVCI